MRRGQVRDYLSEGKTADVRVYLGVQMVGLHCTREGIAYRITFRLPPGTEARVPLPLSRPAHRTRRRGPAWFGQRGRRRRWWSGRCDSGAGMILCIAGAHDCGFLTRSQAKRR